MPSKKRYGAKASEKVGRAMHEMKRGQLRSGGSGKRVTDPKQAIAIGLSEAREAGGKVPPPKNAARKTKRTTARQTTAARKTTARAPRAKKSTARKTAARKRS